MDAISTAFLNFGFGGAIVASFVWFNHFFLTKMLPDLVKSTREEMANQRAEFLAALKEQRDDNLKVMGFYQSNFTQALEKMEDSWNKSTEAICQRIEQLADRVDKLEPR